MHVSPEVRRGVVAVVVRQGRFLVIERSAMVAAPGAYCFPGGGIEPGETEEGALVRELREELGVAAQPVARVWRNVTPWQVELAWWTAAIDVEAEISPAPQEVASVHWLAAPEIVRLPGLLASNREFLAALARGEIELPPGGV